MFVKNVVLKLEMDCEQKPIIVVSIERSLGNLFFIYMIMKKKWLLFLLIFFSFPAFAYQQQGFSKYQESLPGFSFSCENQCVALIGPVNGSDYVDVKGSFS
jgi:hypothetical protein